MEKEVDYIKNYLNEIGKYNTLTRDEERLLGEKISQGDVKAKELFVMHNLKLVIFIANRLIKKNANLRLEDLIEDGNIGLLMAVSKYDINKNCKFSTFAAPIIKQEMIKGMHDDRKKMTISLITQNKIREYFRKKSQLEYELGRIPTIEELMEKINISKRLVLKYETMGNDVVSLNKNIPDTSHELIEFVESNEESLENIVENKVMFKNIKNNLSKILTERELDIINLRYGLIDDLPRTLDQVSEIKKISRECVRVGEIRALRKIRKFVRDDNLIKNDEKYLFSNIYIKSEDVKELSKYLNEMELKVIILKYGLLDGKIRSLRFIGKVLNISFLNLKQILVEAINKLIENNMMEKLIANNKNIRKDYEYLLTDIDFYEEDILNYFYQINNKINKNKLKSIISFLIDLKLTEMEIKVLLLNNYLNVLDISSYFPDILETELISIEKRALIKLKNRDLLKEFYNSLQDDDIKILKK